MSFEAVYRFDTASVRFAVYPEQGQRVLADITENAIRDVTGVRGGGGPQLLDACEAHFHVIQAKALERLKAQPRQLLLDSDDFCI